MISFTFIFYQIIFINQFFFLFIPIYIDGNAQLKINAFTFITIKLINIPNTGIKVMKVK